MSVLWVLEVLWVFRWVLQVFPVRQVDLDRTDKTDDVNSVTAYFLERL